MHRKSGLKNNNKFDNFKRIDKILRYRGISRSRHNKIRLDHNERISKIENYFLKKIKNKINSEYLTTYPETEQLYDLFAKKFKLHRDNFVLTAGSDMAIRNCFELLIKPKDRIIALNPTYGMIDVYSKLFDAKEIKIKFNDKLELQINELIKKINLKTKLIVIANPNSPTGTIINKKQIYEILNKAKKMNCYVLFDEAYYGFYNQTVLSYLNKFSNLIIARTFSKAYGLAGCRVGYIVTNKNLSKKLYKFRPMYEISSISVLIIKEILKNDRIIKKYIQETNKGRKFLEKNLTKLGFSYYKTYSNFLLVNFNKEKLKQKIFNYLQKKNILVREAPNIAACKNHLRFTLGPVKHMKILVNNLKKFKEK